MIIDCIADLHGEYPDLEGGDLLIIAGDLTGSDRHVQYLHFLSWLHKQKYKHFVFIGGNHDGLLQKGEVITKGLADTTYLCDSGTGFEGLKIWGSPWSLWFEGINPHCTAFTLKTEDELAAKWALIPADVDILITHSPPYGIMDGVNRSRSSFFRELEHCGSKSLMKELFSERIRPKLHIYGHIHQGYGHVSKMLDYPYTQFVNCAHMDGDYEPVNKPIRIVL